VTTIDSYHLLKRERERKEKREREREEKRERKSDHLV
jgi:hypothetical protein